MNETTASFSKFARLQSWSPSYVTKLKEAGRLVLTENGKRVRVEASLARIKETESGQPQHVASRRRQQERRNGATEPDVLSADETPSTPEGGVEEPIANSRAHWERREAAARAETREIELAKLKGDLVETAAVRAAGVESGTVLRAALENLPDQIAPMLAEGDPEREQRIRARLAEHIGLALTEIADKFKTLSEQTVETQA